MKKEVEKEFVNLDILKTEKSRKVKFLGKTFELSYIPCGIAIPLVEKHNEQYRKELELAAKSQTPSKAESYQHEIDQVSMFCSFFEPDFTEEYIALHATDKQLVAMYTHIVDAIIRNFPAKETDEDLSENKKKQTGEK